MPRNPSLDFVFLGCVSWESLKKDFKKCFQRTAVSHAHAYFNVVVRNEIRQLFRFIISRARESEIKGVSSR